MRSRFLALFLSLIPSVCFAQFQVLQGSAVDHGLEFDWNFQVNTTLVNWVPAPVDADGSPTKLKPFTFVDATMSGTLDINDRPVPNVTWINDSWGYMPYQTMVMAAWGDWNRKADAYDYELITTPQGAYIQDDASMGKAHRDPQFDNDAPTSVVTPEPETWLLVSVGLVGLFCFRKNLLRVRSARS